MRKNGLLATAALLALSAGTALPQILPEVGTPVRKPRKISNKNIGLYIEIELFNEQVERKKRERKAKK